MLVAILFLLNIQLGEIYYVIQLKGKITNVETNTLLKSGDKLLPDTKLKFSSTDAKAILISNTKGRFIISSNATGTSKNSEIEAFVKNVLLTHDKDDSRYLSTRAVETPTDKADLENYFGSSTYFVLGNQTKINVDVQKYPIDPKKYFLIRYKSPSGPKEVKIAYEGPFLKLDKTQILGLTEQDMVKKMDLYIFDENSRSDEYVTSFTLNFIGITQLNEEMDVQINLFKEEKLPIEEVKKELKAYFVYAYGNVDDKAFDAYLNEKLASY